MFGGKEDIDSRGLSGIGLTVVKQLSCADEVAEVFLHFMMNPYITGTTIVVDGGARLI